MATLSTHYPNQDISNANMAGESDTSTEQFLMYGYKVVQCSKRYRHDWSVCPFAHTGEMAARRDPSRYLPIFCFHSKQRLPCPRGEECPYSHNLFEYWLHPQRYRTEMCQFGASCTRPVCFFAHGEHQLRHTGMPGGPQPVVAPPEPNPALAASGFSGAVTDPAVKQQQQLLALQAAAAGFSSGQMRSDSLLPTMNLGGDGSHMQGGAAGGGYGGLMDGGGSMDVGALHRELSNVSANMSNFNHTLPASAPLSAPLPLPQLSPDLLAALHNMSGQPGPRASLSPNGMGGGLMHQGSGIPPQHTYSQQLPGPGRLARSFTVGANHPALQGNGHTPAIDELAKQLAVMQMMQANGVTNASAPLPQLGDHAMGDLLGRLAQLDSQQQQQQHQQQQGPSSGAGLDLEAFLTTPASGAMLQQDVSFSSPLPPAFSNPSLASMMAAPAASNGLHRVLSANSASMRGLQHQQPQLGGLCTTSPASPAPSDAGRDGSSPYSRDVTQQGGRDTSQAVGKKGHQAWSAPVSPATSAKGGNDLCVNDIKLTSISFTAGTGSRSNASSSSSPGSTSGSIGRLGTGHHGLKMPSFNEGLGGSGQEQDDAPLLLIGDSPLTHVSQLQDALAAGEQGETANSQQQQQPAAEQQPGDQPQQQGMGQEMAVKLLAQLPEDSVRKLLAMMAQQGQ